MTTPSAKDDRRGIVIDLDGPILDISKRHYGVYRKLAGELGFEPVGFEAYWSAKRRAAGTPEVLAWSGASGRSDVYARRFLEEIERPGMLARDSLQPGAAQTLQRWTGEGYALVLATMRQRRDGAREQLEALDVYRYFGAVVVCDAAEGAAGKAAAAREALTALDVSPRLWIGDTRADIDAAAILGCAAWAITSGIRCEDYLATCRPDGMSESLSGVRLDLAAATTTQRSEIAL